MSCKVYLMEPNNAVEQPDVVAVKPLRRYKLWVEFENGKAGEADLDDIRRTEAYEIWNTRRGFRDVKVRHGTASWGEGEQQLDISPSLLYVLATGAKWEEVFPSPPERLCTVKAEDRGADQIYVEFEDGIRGCVKVTSELKTGAIYPATERGGGCSTEPAPWGDVLWRGEIELSAEAIRERLALSG